MEDNKYILLIIVSIITGIVMLFGMNGIYKYKMNTQAFENDYCQQQQLGNVSLFWIKCEKVK